MLTRFDDYCVHQTTEPLAQPATSDRNFYDRYWFNGFDQKGAFIFEAGLGIYPNRQKPYRYLHRHTLHNQNLHLQKVSQQSLF